MKLKEAHIRNFRSIKDVTIEFDPPCRVLVGLNESGKSNILKALALLGGDKPHSLDKRTRTSDEDIAKKDEDCVRFVFRLEDKERKEVRESVMSAILAKSQNPEIANVEGVKKTVKTFCSLDAYLEGLYQMDIPSKDAAASFSYWVLGKEANLLAGWRAISENCPHDLLLDNDGERLVLSDYTLVRTSDYPNIPAEYLKDADIETLKSIVGKAIRNVVKNNMPEVRFWRYKDENFLPAKINIEKFKANPDSCVPLKNMFVLADCDDIATAISQHTDSEDPNLLQNFLKTIAEKTTKHFQSVWKEYKDIKFGLTDNGREILPHIEEQNKYLLERRSDGFKRFISFLLLISAAVKKDKIHNTLLLVDEPEISMHPDGARYLRDELIRISKKSQNYVVYSTHSIFMVDPDKVERHYIVTKQNEKTSTKEAKGHILKDEEILYKALGFTIYEVYEKKNLIFEGWRDARLFKVAMQQAGAIKEKFDNIGVCHAKGVKTIASVVATVELAKRQAIIVADGDTAAKNTQKDYMKDRGSMPFFIYSDFAGITAHTGEDFVKNDHIIQGVKLALDGMDIPAFDGLVLPHKKGKLAAIKKWLGAKPSLSGDDLRNAMDEIKGAIFDRLTYKDIDMPEYEKLLQGIAEKLKLPDGKK